MRPDNRDKNNDDKIDVYVAGATSIWFNAKVATELLGGMARDKYNLKMVCARERELYDAIKRFELIIDENTGHDDYTRRNSKDIITGAQLVLGGLQDGQIKYNQLDTKNNSFGNLDHVKPNSLFYICTSNQTHADYTASALELGGNVLVEKPVVTVVNSSGEPSTARRDKLQKRIGQYIGKRLIMDSEHYSFKKASTIFYNNLEELLDGEKIVSMRGEIIEPGNSEDPRNRKMFYPYAETGLLTDTGVHLLSFVSCLGASAHPTRAMYNVAPGFSVETGAKVEYVIEKDKGQGINVSEASIISNDVFVKDATMKLTVDKFKGGNVIVHGHKSKRLEIELTDKSHILIDFDKGTVFKESGGIYIDKFNNPVEIYNGEYAEIFNKVYDGIINGIKPRTDILNSLKTMNSILETYIKFPIQSNRGPR